MTLSAIKAKVTSSFKNSAKAISSCCTDAVTSTLPDLLVIGSHGENTPTEEQEPKLNTLEVETHLSLSDGISTAKTSKCFLSECTLCSDCFQFWKYINMYHLDVFSKFYCLTDSTAS